MRQGLLKIAVSIWLTFFCALPGLAMKSTPGGDRFGAWVTYWDFEGGVASVMLSPWVFKDVYFFIAVLTSDGEPVLYKPDLPYASVITRLKAGGTRTWLTVVNDVVDSNRLRSQLKDPDLIHSILRNDERRASHRRALIQLASYYGFDGIDVDYENLHVKDKKGYVRFIRELKNDLQHLGLKLSVTVQPKNREKKSRGAGAADWLNLCRYTDQVQIMLYNLHNCRTEPGPMATLSWIKSVMDYGKTKCDIKSLVPVLKVSGMRWGGDQCKALQYKSIHPMIMAHSDLLQRTDEMTPYLRYSENTKNYTIYYEDAKSLSKKVDTLQMLGYDRVTFWSLGRHDPILNKALRQRLEK